jgi:RNA polymerase-binding transcription factor
MSKTIDTERFRATLLEERERVERAIANLRDDHPGAADDEVEEVPGPSDNHLAETATATLDREIDFTLEENSAQVLTEIDAALQRIADGTYGTCTGCGGEIAPERLEAHPWAALCIDCARRAEHR